MRVIGGRAKGRKLKMVAGGGTRPITDRVKESLFDIIGDWVVGTRWLDLFAGTGQVAIEALSRGAESAVLVDSARAAIQIINENLEHTGLKAQATVVRSDAFAFLRAAGSQPFDVIYVAPPQYQGLWEQALLAIDRKAEALVTEGAMVIVQIDPKEYREVELAALELYDQRRYGRTMLCFYEPGPISS
jgi:16S rRNA (guanine(966)-N(2))-methyltransferase RsmD